MVHLKVYIYVINILWAFACKTIVYYSQDIGSKLAWWDPGGTMSSIFILYAQHNDSGADKAALSPQSDPAPPVARPVPWPCQSLVFDIEMLRLRRQFLVQYPQTLLTSIEANCHNLKVCKYPHFILMLNSNITLFNIIYVNWATNWTQFLKQRDIVKVLKWNDRNSNKLVSPKLSQHPNCTYESPIIH